MFSGVKQLFANLHFQHLIGTMWLKPFISEKKYVKKRFILIFAKKFGAEPFQKIWPRYGADDAGKIGKKYEKTHKKNTHKNGVNKSANETLNMRSTCWSLSASTIYVTRILYMFVHGTYNTESA